MRWPTTIGGWAVLAAAYLIGAFLGGALVGVIVAVLGALGGR